MTNSPATAATRWPLVLLLVGAGVVAAFQIGKAPAALPILRGDLGMALPVAAWVISIFNVIGLVTGMTLGAVAERLGHRRTVLAGLAVIAAASALGATAHGPAVLLATRFAEGLGFMIVVVATPTLLVRATAAADVELAFGLWATYMPAGTATMMMLAPALLEASGWRGLWIANAVIVLGFAAALAVATRDLPAPARAATRMRDTILETLRAPGPRLLALTFGSYTLQFLGVFGLLPTLLVEGEHLAPTTAAVLGSLAVAINIPGNLLGGWVVHRGVARWRVIVAVSATMAVCAVLIYAAGLPLAARYALCLVLSLVGGMIPAVVFGAGAALAPSPRHLATTNGLIMQGSNLGQVVGPPAIAAVASATGGWTWSPAVLCASAGLGIALALRLRALEGR